MTLFALLLILSGDPSPLARVSWHPSLDACERQASVELVHAAVTTRAVEHVECRAYRMPALRPVTGEILR